MNRRTVPFWRRVRAARGKIAIFGTWLAACLVCVVLWGAGGTRAGVHAVASVRQYPVLPCEDGRLASLDVRPGQHVAAGQVLAVVEVPGVAQQIAAADAAVRALEAELSVESADLDRKFARDAESARARFLAATVDLQASRAALLETEAELARYTADGVGASAGVVDTLRLSAEAVRAEIVAREAETRELERAWRGANGRTSNAMDRLLASSLDLARGERDALVALDEACTIRATVDGVVGQTVTELRAGSPVGHPGVPVSGQWVVRGTPILTLTETTASEAVAWLGVRQARSLRPGSPATLTDEDGRETEAVVVSVGAAVEPVPLRVTGDPAFPQWGVPVTFAAEGVAFTPGEALSVSFRAGSSLVATILNGARPARADTKAPTP